MKRIEHAVLDEDGNVIPAGLMEWARWVGRTRQRKIEWTELPGDVRVSTVFLGLNHQYGDGPPLWFETMVFGPPGDNYQDCYCERYTTLGEARAGHAAAVDWAIKTKCSRL